MNCTKHLFCVLLAVSSAMLAGCSGKNAQDEEDTPVLLKADTVLVQQPAAGEYTLERDRVVAQPVEVEQVIVPEQLPIKKVGELVLKDSIKIYNNEVISFMLLDSLLSPKRSSRDFYFKVFNKMMDRSGGKMGDAIGDYALTYVENYPGEFLANSKNLSEDRLASWASNIGIELYLGEGDSKQAYDKSVKQFAANCKKCDTSDMARLQNFNQLIWTTIEQNLKKRKP